MGLGPFEVLAPSASEATPRCQPGLLLVDGDPFMLGMQSRMLRSTGYTMIGIAAS